MRERLHAVFAAVARAEPPPREPLAYVEKHAARGLATLRLTAADEGRFVVGWPEPSLETPVQQIAASALLLLGSEELDRVKECPGPTCGWVFLDSTRNRSRRWCSSAKYGNRHRAQEHYRRTRATA